MARKLPRFPDELLSRTTQRYPWDEWLDGDVWELTKGEDYTIKTKSIRTTAQQAAREKGGRAKCAEADNGDKLILQFVPAKSNSNGPQRTTIRQDSDRTKAIRAWAKENGWPDLADHGRLPGDVLTAFDRAETHPHGGVVHPFPSR